MSGLLFIAILPVILLLIYIYKKDPHKEPFSNLIKIFIFGIFSTIPAVIGELIAAFFLEQESSDYLMLFIYIFIGVALIEEFVKWIIIKTFVYKTDRFDEYYDAIVYCTFASLGFACLENILYVLQNGFGNGILRALTAVPGHTCFGVIMGYYLCYTKFHEIRQNKEYNKYNFKSLLAPVLAHTLYDYLIFANMIIPWLIFYIYLLIYCIKLVKKVSYQNQPFYLTNTYQENINNYQTTNNNNSIQTIFCPNCGVQVSKENFCQNCGYKL